MLFQIIKQTNVDVISLLSSTTSFLLIIKKTDPQESLTQRNVYNVIDHAVNRYDFSSKTHGNETVYLHVNLYVSIMMHVLLIIKTKSKLIYNNNSDER